MSARHWTLIVLGFFVGAFQIGEFVTRGEYNTPPLIGILAQIAVTGVIGLEGIEAVRGGKKNGTVPDKPKSD